MEKFPFDTYRIDPEQVKILDEIYSALKSAFSVELTNENSIELKSFDAFSNLKEAKIVGTLLINNTERVCHLVFVKLLTNIPLYRDIVSYYNYQVWGSITMKRDFGRILIRRETFVDKILNSMHPFEVHFENDAAFNRKFCVVANDEKKAVSAMTTDLRDELKNIPIEDFTVEIVREFLLVGNNKPLTPEYIINLTRFVSSLASLS